MKVLRDHAALPAVVLIGYVLVSGLRSTVLKALQNHGASHPIGGENPISFCNVFLISQLMIGIALMLSEPGRLRRELSGLTTGTRRWLVADAALGCFLAPLAFFLALEQLTVITQTLLFSLTLPATALLAWRWLGERLPPRFGLSLTLILVGLLVGKLFGSARGMGMDQLPGILWALVSVSATAVRSSIRRRFASLNLGRGLSIGVPNLAGALVFGAIALQQFGPQHFFYLRFWWVLGVIVIYGLTLCLGTEVLRQLCIRLVPVAPLALASNASLVVTVFSAALLLREPLTAAVLISTGLIVAGVMQRFLPGAESTLLMPPTAVDSADMRRT